MQTTKIFLMAALALMTAACSNDDTNILTPAEQPAKAEGIPFTATISMGESASTRALTEDTENKKIVATWATGEKVALIYDAGGTPTKTDAEVTKQADGTATISATLASGATNGSDVTIIYPATAADGTTGKVLANLLTAQDGTLATIASKYDVRKGTGKLSINAGKATVNNGTAGTTVALTNQFAIWKLTLNNDAKNLCIMADNITIAGATLGTADKEFTVAVPAVSSKKVTIVANDESNNCYYYSKAGVSLYAGKYYQSKPTMTALDEDNSKPLYKITATSGVTIPSGGKTVVLSGVNISSGSITCNGNATIILMGTNKVTAAASNAAIRVVGTGTTLTITGTGSLTATGGDSGAGIGTGYSYEDNVTGGNIVINGGTVTAISLRGAGIGTGMAEPSGSGNPSQTCGTITINGGTVTATSDLGAGIGTGEASSSSSGSTASQTCGTITINGGTVTAISLRGAGIGTGEANSISSGNASQTCGTITINGGTVTATGSIGSAGIGTGSVLQGSNTCGDITIGTGVTSVIATRGLDSPNSIGPGYASTPHTQHCGKITFGTKQVFDGGTDLLFRIEAGTYGGLNLAISTTTNTDDTWTLTPAP